MEEACISRCCGEETQVGKVVDEEDLSPDEVRADEERVVSRVAELDFLDQKRYKSKLS